MMYKHINVPPLLCLLAKSKHLRIAETCITLEEETVVTSMVCVFTFHKPTALTLRQKVIPHPCADAAISCSVSLKMKVLLTAGLGATLLKQGRVDEAKTLITKAATLTFVKLGERHQQSLDAMNWLAECKSSQRNT